MKKTIDCTVIHILLISSRYKQYDTIFVFSEVYAIKPAHLECLWPFNRLKQLPITIARTHK